MVETALEFVLGAVVGAVATAIGSYLLYWKRDRDTTRRLRQALGEELRSYDHLEGIVDDGGYELVTTRVERPVVYESAAGELGRLSQAEIGPLVSFYSSLYWLDGLEDPEDKKERIDSVVQSRNDALEALGAE